MRFRLAAAAGLMTIGASALSAQTPSPNCPSGTGPLTPERASQDACQQAVDLFNYMRPQLGIAIAGGNSTLGQGGALGGLPHFAIGLRANVLAGSVPTIQPPGTGGAQQRSNYPTKDTPLGLPVVDAAIGLFKGLPMGVTNVGGVDLLLSASYVPKVEASNVSVEPDTPLQIGYGLRVGLLQESLLMPGVGISVIRRGLPKTTITGTVQGTGLQPDTVQVQDLDLKTTAWRLTASKSLILFTIAAGVGQDKYSAGTTINAVVHAVAPFPTRSPMTANINESMTRTNYFADVSMNLLVLKLIGEVGMVSGGSANTFNTFDTKADASRLYGSVGIRVGF
jgi:hypothetical protein